MATAISRENFLRDVSDRLGQVPRWLRALPDPGLNGFWGLMRDFYLADTQVPAKYKALIGLSVSGATQCQPCALFYTEMARLHGATDAEIAEASLMGGVTACASTFLRAQQIDDETFRKETMEIVAFLRQRESGRAKPAARHEVHA